MANGYCPALLRHVQEIAEGAYAGAKIHTSGFLRMLFCCANSSVSPINDGNKSNSHKQTLTVKYRQRPVDSHVQDEDDCDINRIPAYAEWTLPNLSHKQTSFYLSDEEIKLYCDDASRMRNFGITDVMNEHYLLWLEHVNILMKVINEELVTEMSTKFGDNVTTGTGASVININSNGANLQLDDGIIALLQQLRDNEICDDPCLVGGGLFSAYDMARIAQCCSQAGIDASRLGIPDFWHDRSTQSIWGTDTVGVFQKGSVKMLTYNKYMGSFAGEKGGSIFFTVPFPVNEFKGCDPLACLRDLRIDVQMRYIDCPTVVTVNGVETTVNRGWQVILSKEFGLWVQPNQYAAGDPLFGTNGTLLYFVTNTGTSPGAYSYS